MRRVILGRNVWAMFVHVRVSLTPMKSFLPCDVTYAILEPAIPSHGGQRSWERGHLLLTVLIHVTTSALSEYCHKSTMLRVAKVQRGVRKA